MTALPFLPPETALVDTVRFTAARAETCLDDPACLPWLVTGAVLMAQQAAAIALRAVGDTIPEKSGATEILLRAAHADRLPSPYTLPLPSHARRCFDALVDARNAHMHPRAGAWHVSPPTLARGLPVATAAVRHLILMQPVVPDLVTPSAVGALSEDLSAIEALAEFLDE